MKLLVPFAFGVVLLSASVILAQTLPEEARAEFEAVSVKVQRSGSIDPLRPESILAGMEMMRGGPGTSAPGRIHYSNVSLMSLLTKAYDVKWDQVQGPGWLTQDRFAVDAVVPPGATEEQFRQMLQNLIVERFKLAFRWEEKEFKVYRLLAGKGEPKLKRSAVMEENDEADAIAALGMAANAGVGANGCPTLDASRHAAISRGTCMTYVGWSMAELARKTLSLAIGSESGVGWAHVVDETGLRGRFDFTLNYDFANQLMRNSRGPAASDGGSPVSIFKAVETELGLRIEPSTARLKLMIIRQVERTPTEN